MSQVVVVTNKKKIRSNSLPFLFVPPGAPTMFTTAGGNTYDHPIKMPMQFPTTLTSTDDLDFTSYPSSLTSVEVLESILDTCVQSLDKKAEEEILPVATLPPIS